MDGTFTAFAFDEPDVTLAGRFALDFELVVEAAFFSVAPNVDTLDMLPMLVEERFDESFAVLVSERKLVALFRATPLMTPGTDERVGGFPEVAFFFFTNFFFFFGAADSESSSAASSFSSSSSSPASSSSSSSS